VATHNVSGLTTLAAVTGLVAEWHAAALDVICLQETWARPDPDSASALPSCGEIHFWLNQAADALGIPRYTVHWGANAAAHHQGNGVAILVRPASGADVTPLHSSPCGRLQAARLQWGGHVARLVNAYWPCTGHADRAAFLHGILAPALPSSPHPAPVIVVGDFNFTVDPASDRVPAPPASTAAADIASAAAWGTACPDLVDIYRLRHPTRRSFTFHRPHRLARLDRAYASPALAAFTTSPRVLPSSHGDHHTLAFTLLPAAPVQTPGPGRRPIPASVTSVDGSEAALAAWAQRAVAHGMTLSHEALLQCWPAMVTSYAAYARCLASHATLQRQRAADSVAAAREAAEGALHAAGAAGEDGLQQQRLAAVTQAQAAYRTAAQHAAAPAARSARDTWLGTREYPSPAITAFIRPQRRACVIPALTDAGGNVVTANAAIASRLVAAFSAVSGAPHTDPAARQEVLAALQAEVDAGVTRRITAADAAMAGNPTVTPAEVAAALRASNPGSSPGPDGVPFSLWKVGDGVWAPLLARLFTAMGTLDQAPPGFTHGTITPLLKPGAPDTTSPSSYRPITLLNSLYRLHAKVMATRFGHAMAPAISPEQTAFLPGRRIEDSVAFTSLLSAALEAAGVPGVALFLDIAKAYDTVDRDFIFSVMAIMGAGGGMTRWARLLLRDTVATVHANGVESGPRHWAAGVRQGCPLSPLLYLFATQALISWVRAQPELGVTIGGRRHVTSVYADDTTLVARQDWPTVTAALDTTLPTYTAASNQTFNLPKSHAVLVGAPPVGPAPPALAGAPVVPAITSLGVPFAPSRAFPPRRFPYGPYGTRAADRPPVAAAEPPPHPLVAASWERRRATAAARTATIAGLPLSGMGRGLAISAYAHSTTYYHAEHSATPDRALTTLNAEACAVVGDGVPPAWHSLLFGRPADGAFGLLDSAAHVTARHGAMACRLVHNLRLAEGEEAAQPLSPGTPQQGSPRPPPPQPHIPAWTWLAAALLRHACPALHPAQTLLAATATPREDVVQGRLHLPGVQQPNRTAPGTLTRLAAALRALGALHLDSRGLPPDAPATTLAVLTTPGCPALEACLGALAWPGPARGGHAQAPAIHPCDQPEVNTLYGVLAAPHATSRWAAHAAFVAQAMGGRAAAVDADVTSFRRALDRAWALPCDNRTKEPLWRLAVNAFRGAHFQPWRCPSCAGGAASAAAARQHAFWDCPVAEGVREQLAVGLGLGGAALVTQPAVWLLRPPRRGIAPEAWALVAMSAVAAMEYGRRLLWVPGPAGGRADPQRVRRLAAARFWQLLANHAADIGPVPRGWELPEPHPFLFVSPDGRLRVRLPDA